MCNHGVSFRLRELPAELDVVYLWVNQTHPKYRSQFERVTVRAGRRPAPSMLRCELRTSACGRHGLPERCFTSMRASQGKSASGRAVGLDDEGDYRAHNELMFSMRSLESSGMLQVVRRVLVVIDPVHGPPSWLNVSHPQLRVVSHAEFLPVRAAASRPCARGRATRHVAH